MATFLADQNFEDAVVAELTALGHDVVTVRAVSLETAPDPVVLAAATAAGRAVLTHNRDFLNLYKSGVAHAGVVFTTMDPDAQALAARIHTAVSALPSLAGQLVRVNRPNPPPGP